MTASRQIKLFALSFLLFTLLSKSFAWAGDRASRQVFGFSPDGRIFAFEGPDSRFLAVTHRLP